jgi:hypothetical protein
VLCAGVVQHLPRRLPLVAAAAELHDLRAHIAGAKSGMQPACKHPELQLAEPGMRRLASARRRVSVWHRGQILADAGTRETIVHETAEPGSTKGSRASLHHPMSSALDMRAPRAAGRSAARA